MGETPPEHIVEGGFRTNPCSKTKQQKALKHLQGRKSFPQDHLYGIWHTYSQGTGQQLRDPTWVPTSREVKRLTAQHYRVWMPSVQGLQIHSRKHSFLTHFSYNVKCYSRCRQA